MMIPPVNKRGRGTKKNVVVGCVDRVNKSVFAKVMIKNNDGKKLTSKQLFRCVEPNYNPR